MKLNCPACDKPVVDATKINANAEVKIICSCGSRSWLANSMVGGSPTPYLKEDPIIVHPSRLDKRNPREAVIKIHTMRQALEDRRSRIDEFLDILSEHLPTFARPLGEIHMREKQVAHLMEDTASTKKALIDMLSTLTDEERAAILRS